jgi:hypothetical protein
MVRKPKTRKPKTSKKPSIGKIKARLRDGECTTVGDKTLCKLGGVVREGAAPT